MKLEELALMVIIAVHKFTSKDRAQHTFGTYNSDDRKWSCGSLS